MFDVLVVLLVSYVCFPWQGVSIRGVGGTCDRWVDEL